MKIKKIPVEVYSRVVGYYRPVSQWNKGKREEFKDRREFKPEKILQATGENKLKRDDHDIQFQ